LSRNRRSSAKVAKVHFPPQIPPMKPLMYKSIFGNGDLQTYDAKWKVFTLDERSEVVHMSRNIQVLSSSEAVNTGRGGQIMATSGSVLKLQYVEIDQGGHEEMLGRYPVHFHILGDTPGQMIRGCSITRSVNRCITVHTTNNVLIENNVCFDIKGHAFFLENGIETGNRFLGNIGMYVKQSDLLPTDSQPTIFWITNSNNTFVKNVASGCYHTCFWWLGNAVPLNEDQQKDVVP
jgi:cell surface hyaluronidase